MSPGRSLGRPFDDIQQRLGIICIYVHMSSNLRLCKGLLSGCNTIEKRHYGGDFIGQEYL